MFRIAVCDDEKVYLDCLSKKIEVCFKEFEIEISLDKYLNAVSFLEQHEQNPYDVVFLDILMPEMNGLDVANRIRNLSEKTIIIFIKIGRASLSPQKIILYTKALTTDRSTLFRRTLIFLTKSYGRLSES